LKILLKKKKRWEVGPYFLNNHLEYICQEIILFTVGGFLLILRKYIFSETYKNIIYVISKFCFKIILNLLAWNFTLLVFLGNYMPSINYHFFFITNIIINL